MVKKRSEMTAEEKKEDNKRTQVHKQKMRKKSEDRKASRKENSRDKRREEDHCSEEIEARSDVTMSSTERSRTIERTQPVHHRTRAPASTPKGGTPSKPPPEKKSRREKEKEKSTPSRETDRHTAARSSGRTPETRQAAAAAKEYTKTKIANLAMRKKDCAQTNIGFCHATGYDIKGTQGCDGFSGYQWNSKYPYDRQTYEQEWYNAKNDYQVRDHGHFELHQDRINRIIHENETDTRQHPPDFLATSEDDGDDDEVKPSGYSRNDKWKKGRDEEREKQNQGTVESSEEERERETRQKEDWSKEK